MPILHISKSGSVSLCHQVQCQFFKPFFFKKWPGMDITVLISAPCRAGISTSVPGVKSSKTPLYLCITCIQQRMGSKSDIIQATKDHCYVKESCSIACLWISNVVVSNALTVVVTLMKLCPWLQCAV